jgi:hypothetical protein
VQRPVHHQDGRHHVILVVAPSLAEPRHVADVHLGDVLDLHRNAIHLGKRNVFDILDPKALGQIRRAAGVDQAHAAHVHGLLAHVDGAPANIHVGVADRRDHLGYGDTVGIEPVEIDFDLVLLGGPAPGIDLHNSWNRQEAALENPVLDGA